MGLLSLNLIFCSLDRFPIAWRRFRRKPLPDDETVFKDLPPENIINTRLDQKSAADLAAAFLKKRFYRIQKQADKNTVLLCADKGKFSHFGVYVVHLSILIFIAGAVVGSIFGLEGYVNIIEGETIQAIELSGNKTLPLPFSVRCDSFVVELYENGTPKTYRSELTFLKDNRSIRQGKLLVNHPLTFEGFHFYQASYGLAPEGRAVLDIIKNGKMSMNKKVGLGDVFDLPGKEGKVHVLRVEENLMNMGPAVKLSVLKDKGETLFWVFAQIEKIREMNPHIIERIPMFNPGLFRPYIFVLTGMDEKYYTGLQVSRDPGTPVVGAAAVLMIIGLIMVLFFYARQIWIRIEREGETTKVSVAGRSHKNKPGLEREIQHFTAQLKRNPEHNQ